MQVAGDGVEDVAAVELSHRQQVERGREHADPRRQREGVEVEHRARRQPAVEDEGEQVDREVGARAVEHHGRRTGRLGDHGRSRPRHAEHEEWHQRDEAGDRTGDADVEQLLLGVIRARMRMNAPKVPRPERSGQEVRRGRRHPVTAAGEEVAELVAAQDDQQREREGEAEVQQSRSRPHRRAVWGVSQGGNPVVTRRSW